MPYTLSEESKNKLQKLFDAADNRPDLKNRTFSDSNNFALVQCGAIFESGPYYSSFVADYNSELDSYVLFEGQVLLSAADGSALEPDKFYTAKSCADHPTEHKPIFLTTTSAGSGTGGFSTEVSGTLTTASDLDADNTMTATDLGRTVAAGRYLLTATIPMEGQINEHTVNGSYLGFKIWDSTASDFFPSGGVVPCCSIYASDVICRGTGSWTQMIDVPSTTTFQVFTWRSTIFTGTWYLSLIGGDTSAIFDMTKIA